MKRTCSSFLTLSAILVLLTPAVSHAAPAWQKFISPDKTFSFHYPQGWKVQAKESTIEITNASADEQLLVVALPYDKAKTPTDSAKFLIDAIRTSSSPDITAANWESNSATKDSTISCRATYSDSGRKYQSEVLVVKDDSSGQVLWFSFSGPEAGYSRSRALDILQGLVSSLAKGTGSTPPGVTMPAAAGTLELNARAFMFVLEFALGAPLTEGQEETVLVELRRGWGSRPAEDLKKYDAYPKIVDSIVHAGDRAALDDLRRKLEASTREWIETSDRSDPAVALIAGVLKEKGKVLIPGNPALTIMAADSYSELYAYSELLARIPNAVPDRVSPSVVAEIKSQLLKAWSGFTPEQRGQVASTPGLWVSIRSVLRYAPSADQTRIRAQLVKIAAPSESSEEPTSQPGGQGSVNNNYVRNLVKHQVLMNINQMTFNHYMYCHGFKSSIY